MKTGKRIALALAAAVFTSGLLAGCSGASGSANSAAPAGSAASDGGEQAAYTLKVAVGIPQSHKDIGAKFKEVVESRTNGQIQVNVFADNSLGADREVLEATQIGDIDITLSNVAPLAATYSDLYLFDAPFLFETREKAFEILDGEIGQEIAKGLESKNLKILSYPENGFRNMTANREIHTPADMSDLKIRVMENNIQLATWKALGANPTPMAFNEVFTALQQGTIDAQENPVELIYDNKLNEVQSYLIMTKHMYNPLVLAMNLEKFNSLPDEFQQIVLDAAREATEYERTTAPQYEQQALDAIAKDATTQIIELTPEETAQFQQAVQSVNDIVRNEMEHPELFDRTLELLQEE